MIELKSKIKKFFWTRHILKKMKYYQLSKQRVKRVLRHPERVEKGIAPKTIAAMQRAGGKKKYEIWIMYQIGSDKIKMISAWRYPGETEAGEKVPVPQEILEDLRKLNVKINKEEVKSE